MKSINFHFIASGLASLIAVGLATFTSLPLPLAILLELGPLGWYFLRLLREARQESLGQTAIDSIYYFGFLITIFSLAASVFRVWIYGIGQDIGALIAHFGVGLLATGLALAFRMCLTAITENLGKKDLDETIEAYIRRVDDVVVKVEISAASFEGLAHSLQERTESVVSQAASSFEETMDSAAQTFRDNLSLISKDATDAIQLFSATVKNISLSEHVVAFDRDMLALTAGMRGFASEMSVFGQRLAEDAHKATMVALANTVAAHSDGLTKITAQSKRAMDDILDGVDDLDFTDDAAIIREHMQALSTTVNNITKKFASLESKIEHAAVHQSAETVRLVVDGFSKEFSGISTTIEKEALKGIQTILKNISVETEKTITSVSKTAGDHIANEMIYVSTTIAQVSENIKRVNLIDQVAGLAVAVEDAQSALSDSAIEFHAVVNEMKKLEIRISSINPVFVMHEAQSSVNSLIATIRDCETNVISILDAAQLHTSVRVPVQVSPGMETHEDAANLAKLYAK